MSVSRESIAFSLYPFINRRLITVIIMFAGVLLVSCSEGKVAQCNKLIEIANQAASDVESVTQSSTPEDPTAFLQIAATADNASSELEAIEIEDETLQGFRQRFITLYVETSAATQDLVAAVEEQNAPGAEEAYNRLEAATEQEGPLVDEVNSYCGGTPQ